MIITDFLTDFDAPNAFIVKKYHSVSFFRLQRIVVLVCIRHHEEGMFRFTSRGCLHYTGETHVTTEATADK